MMKLRNLPERKKSKTCPVCGKELEVIDGINRCSNRRYCDYVDHNYDGTRFLDTYEKSQKPVVPEHVGHLPEIDEDSLKSYQ